MTLAVSSAVSHPTLPHAAAVLRVVRGAVSLLLRRAAVSAEAQGPLRLSQLHSVLAMSSPERGAAVCALLTWIPPRLPPRFSARSVEPAWSLGLSGLHQLPPLWRAARTSYSEGGKHITQ